MKKLIFGSLLIAPFLLSFGTLLFSSSNLVYIIDFFFYMGLLLLMIGSVIVIFRAEFFSAFISTTKHFFSTINKKEQAIRRFEGENNAKTAYKKEYPRSKEILLIGAIYFSFSIIASIIVVFSGY